MLDGVWNWVTQVQMNAQAMLADIFEDSGAASAHQVVQSTIVRRWVNPWEGDKCRTRSTLTWSKCLSGTENSANVALAGFQQEMEVLDGEVEAKELTMKGAVLPIFGVELAAEKGEQLPDAVNQLLMNGANSIV
ncbi:hypothetical protein AAFF_G00289650 [Aldrovandia affinis]|uniref:Uncharacterized protein n=1 Tax=Aldrovandia affinis TaxID=143900 RepID=A0AAD7RA78_9TELE|nr:hypothetical protein AAFF_G00289650 [Aldrovandia affinis]